MGLFGNKKTKKQELEEQGKMLKVDDLVPPPPPPKPEVPVHPSVKEPEKVSETVKVISESQLINYKLDLLTEKLDFLIDELKKAVEDE